MFVLLIVYVIIGETRRERLMFRFKAFAVDASDETSPEALVMTTPLRCAPEGDPRNAS